MYVLAGGTGEGEGEAWKYKFPKFLPLKFLTGRQFQPVQMADLAGNFSLVFLKRSVFALYL